MHIYDKYLCTYSNDKYVIFSTLVKGKFTMENFVTVIFRSKHCVNAYFRDSWYQIAMKRPERPS